MASEDTNYNNNRITKLATDKSNLIASGKADAAGLIDLSIQVGFAGMELTRISGGEGRKGSGR